MICPCCDDEIGDFDFNDRPYKEGDLCEDCAWMLDNSDLETRLDILNRISHATKH